MAIVLPTDASTIAVSGKSEMMLIVEKELGYVFSKISKQYETNY